MHDTHSTVLKIIYWFLIDLYCIIVYTFHSFIVEAAIMSAFSAIFFLLVLFVLGIYGLLLLNAKLTFLQLSIILCLIISSSVRSVCCYFFCYCSYVLNVLS